MSSVWNTSESRRGAYTSVAQAEDAGLELRVLPNGDRSKPESELSDGKRGSEDDPAARLSLDDDEPTVEELTTLRRVPDRLPWSAFLVAVVELCERFAYYGLSGPFQNYMANEWHDPNGLPGALGLKQTGATALSNFFQFWCYVTPIIGAMIALGVSRQSTDPLPRSYCRGPISGKVPDNRILLHHLYDWDLCAIHHFASYRN
jgi:hypothetical protein